MTYRLVILLTPRFLIVFPSECGWVGVKVDIGNIIIPFKNIPTKCSDVLRDSNGFKRRTETKALVSNRCNAVGQSDGSQIFTVKECTVSNGLNSFGHGDAFKRKAAQKSVSAN